MLAQDIAVRENRQEPTISDLALALLEFKAGVAAAVLKRLQCDAATLNAVDPGPKASDPLKTLLPLAQKEMQDLWHHYLGTEHLLLALLLHDANPLGSLLKKRGLTSAMVREEILRELDPNFVPGK